MTSPSPWTWATDVLQVDIILTPGGWLDQRQVIQRVAVWNVSLRDETSTYAYAVSLPVAEGDGRHAQLPSGRDLVNDRGELTAGRGHVTHRRSDGAAALVALVLEDFLPTTDKATD